MSDLRNRNKGLRKVRVADIEDNPKNYRRHNESQKQAFNGTVEEIGWYGYPDVFETGDGKLRLVDGELRKHTLLERYGADAEIEVNVTDFDEADADVALATKDPLAAMASNDEKALSELLRDLDPENDDLRTLLDGLVSDAQLEEDSGGRGDADDVPEPPDEPTTQRGDIWILDRHRVMCGNSGSETDLDLLLDGASIHLVNTDPPYNVKVEPRSNNAIAAGLSSFSNKHHQKFDLERHPEKAKGTHAKMRAKDRPLANDFVTDEEFDELLAAWFGNIARVLDAGRSFYIWGGYANCANYPPVMKAMDLYFSQAIIWVKEHPVLTRKDFMGNHEWCFYGWKKGAGHQFFGPNNAQDVWSVKKVNPQSMVHLTEKPVELARRAIEYSSRSSENVLDLFGGSGSTLIACEQLKRRAFLMELDPAYCDVIVERWEKYTGKKAARRQAKAAAS